ncbi:MAG TPA: hypothetical protein PK683_13720, partial [Leptospiraceae bacterium]|nr:hypothetical protein [Leptospiraceae bacterium]
SLKDLILNQAQFRTVYASTRKTELGFSIGFSFPVDVPEQKSEVKPESEKTEEKSDGGKKEKSEKE